jgi:hypothetical protein
LSELMLPQFLPQKLTEEYRSIGGGRGLLRVKNNICKIKNLRLCSGSNLFGLWILSRGARGCISRGGFFLIRILRIQLCIYRNLAIIWLLLEANLLGWSEGR